MPAFVLSPLEEKVLRTLNDTERIFLTIYQLAVEVDDFDVGQLQGACRQLRRLKLATGDDERGWGATGIGAAYLAQLNISRLREAAHRG